MPPLLEQVQGPLEGLLLVLRELQVQGDNAVEQIEVSLRGLVFAEGEHHGLGPVVAHKPRHVSLPREHHHGRLDRVGHRGCVVRKYFAHPPAIVALNPGDGLRVRAAEPRHPLDPLQSSLGPLGHRGHDLDALVGEAAVRALAAQHHRVGSLPDRDGDVRDLGPRGRRVIDHGLQHVGGHDDRLAQLPAGLDDPLLQDGDLLHRELRPKVTPGHHGAVRRLQDLVQVGDRVCALDLDQDFDVGLLLHEIGPQLVHHVLVLHKRQGVVVHTGPHAKLDVLPVLVGDRRQRCALAPDVQVPPRLEDAAVNDFTLHVLWLDSDDLEGHHPAVHQEQVPDVDVVDEVVVVHRARVLPRLEALLSQGKGEGVARGEFHGLHQVTRTYLGTLGVEHNRDTGVVFLVVPPDQVDDLAVRIVVPVRHVQSRNVHSRIRELTERLPRGGRRADGCHDLRLPHEVARPPLGILLVVLCVPASRDRVPGRLRDRPRAKGNAARGVQGTLAPGLAYVAKHLLRPPASSSRRMASAQPAHHPADLRSDSMPGTRTHRHGGWSRSVRLVVGCLTTLSPEN
mmetsp:Transcript_8439/g.28964  ORF Transcript_8439/g.28964 Transcript_8439/m.28964 type:complete len:566 (+) Transcript_8439:192-1889(+)